MGKEGKKGKGKERGKIVRGEGGKKGMGEEGK